MWISIFRILNNDQLFFALMATIFFPLHKPILAKFGFSRTSNEDKSQNFNKIFIIFIGITWVIAALFLSITILRIPMNNPDIFNLSLLWAFSIVFICILLTYIINKALPNEKRIAKKLLRNSMIVGGLIAFGIWSIQLFIFELYLNRWLGVEVFKQDIRVQFIVISGLYTIFFFNPLKTKFLPEISERSSKKIQKLLQSEIEKQIRHDNTHKTELVLEDQDSIIPNLNAKDRVFRLPEGISFKIYAYFLKKFGNSRLLDEKLLLNSVFNKKSSKILGGLLWAVTLVISIIVRLIKPNSLVDVFFLSYVCAFILIFGDFFLIFLFNRINPVDKRIPKILLQNTILFGGIIAFWIWMVPFFIIYTYLFILISETIILNITYMVILSMLMFTLGTRIVRWYAGDVKMWNKSKRKASRINFIWLIINMPLRIFFLFFIGGIILGNFILSYDDNFLELLFIHSFRLGDLLIVVSNIFIGIVLVPKVYKRKLSESLKFLIGIQIIIFFVSIFVKQILAFFQSLITIYNFNLQDIRIPLLVATGIYTITFFATLKIKLLLPGTAEGVKERFRTIIQPTEEIQLQPSMGDGNSVILNVQDLTTYFYTEEGVVRAVEGVSFKIYKGETLGLVGETGCGKSVTALSILRLVRPPGEIKGGRVIFDHEDLHQKTEEDFLSYRGKKIAMIFQDPLNSLNPVFKIGNQISEVYLLHMEDELLIEAATKNTSIYSVARKWSQRILKDLNIPTPRIIFDRYPHELSGGMRQRVQIAMALACSPKLLIADEPTTALDVTVQNQILKLMKNLKKKYNTSILFITHDLGIISKMCDRVAVMYSGFIVEYGDIEKLFRTPYHPYTRGLIASVPIVGKKRELLEVIPGTVPNLIYPPSGCRFHPRCQYCFEPCDSKIPKSIEMESDYFVACHLYDPQYKDAAEISIKKAES